MRRVRDDIRHITAGHAIRRAEVRAYVEAIDRLQQDEFGGEDPLDPLMRALITDTQATEQRFEETWTAVTAAITSHGLEEDQGWPPPFEDEAYLERLRPDVERHLRGDWGP
jgi:hypothetical protein